MVVAAAPVKTICDRSSSAPLDQHSGGEKPVCGCMHYNGAERIPVAADSPTGAWSQ